MNSGAARRYEVVEALRFASATLNAVRADKTLAHGKDSADAGFTYNN